MSSEGEGEERTSKSNEEASYETQINDVFILDITHSDVQRFQDFNRKSQMIKAPFAILSMMFLLLSFVELLLGWTPFSEGFFIAMFILFFVSLMIVTHLVLRPWEKKRDKTGVTHQKIARLHMNDAIEYYDDGGYSETKRCLRELESTLHSNSNYLLGYDEEIANYIMNILGTEDTEKHICETFPLIASPLLVESKARTKSETNIDMATEIMEKRKSPSETTAPDFKRFYRNLLSNFITPHRRDITIILFLCATVLAIHQFIAQGLAVILGTLLAFAVPAYYTSKSIRNNSD